MLNADVSGYFVENLTVLTAILEVHRKRKWQGIVGMKYEEILSH